MLKPIKIDITDDHPLAISGLKKMLSGHKGFCVKNTYESGEALLDGLSNSQPDVLLLDVQLPGLKGPELAARISKDYPEIKIMAITSHDAPFFIKAMMDNGCKGYVLKNIRVKELLEAIETICLGSTYLEPQLKEKLLEHEDITRSHLQNEPVLSQRELEVLNLIVHEYTNKEIAEKLFLSLRTVENHRFSLLQKMNAKNVAGLVRTAIQFNLI